MTITLVALFKALVIGGVFMFGAMAATRAVVSQNDARKNRFVLIGVFVLTLAVILTRQW